MDDTTLKNQMVNDLLSQQSKDINYVQGSDSNTVVRSSEPPTDEMLAKFKQLVSMYIHNDDLRKKLQMAMKEQNNKVKSLGKNILLFMAKYGYEDLKAPCGSRLRYKKRVTKEPLSAKTIHDRIDENFEFLKNKTREEVEEYIFGRKEIEKVSLKRLKNNMLEL
jgi:hypothetical protein